MLISPDWLISRISDPAVRIVEVDVSAAAYDEWHIEGAVLWNIYADMKDERYRPLGDDAVQRLFERSGIGPGTTVVCYGYAPALGAWLLRLYGHADVRVMNCSRAHWRAQGHPIDTASVRVAPTRYDIPGRDTTMFADAAAVARAIGRPGTTILDVRTASEYAGERFWPSGGMAPGGRAGHVPTALSLPLSDLYDPHGAFRPPDDLRRALLPDPDPIGDDDLIVYCTVGARAATAWFVLTGLLGRDRVRVYDGSWAEWGLRADTAVAT